MTDIHAFEPIFGAWYVEELLGKGSFGNVYRARRTEFGNTFYSAIKHISIDDTEDVPARQQAEALSREININYQLRGETHFVSFEDSTFLPKPNGNGIDVFIRMELLNSLPHYMKTTPLTEQEIVRMGIEICEALDGLEKRSIIHRDIKPANIFVSDTGSFKLGDFGVARSLSNTTSGMTVTGTFNYMAPEIYRGGTVNMTADIYSLGLVLYRLLNADRAPFMPLPPASPTFEDANAAMSRRMNGEALPPPANASRGLADIVMKACEYDPLKRWPTAKAFSVALQSVRTQATPDYPRRINTPPKGDSTPAHDGGNGGLGYSGYTAREERGTPRFPKAVLFGGLAAACVAAGLLISVLTFPRNNTVAEPDREISSPEVSAETLEPVTSELTETSAEVLTVPTPAQPTPVPTSITPPAPTPDPTQNGSIPGAFVSGDGWVLYANIPEALENNMYRDEQSSSAIYYLGNNYIFIQAKMYTGNALNQLVREVYGGSQNYYSEDDLFRYLADQFYQNYDFSQVYSASQLDTYLGSHVHNGLTWLADERWKGYRTQQDLMDISFQFHIEQGAVFTVAIVSRLYGNDAEYATAYDVFLNDERGWIYLPRDSLLIEHRWQG